MPENSERKPQNQASTNQIFKICGIVSLFALGGFLLVSGFNILLLILAGALIAIYFRGLGLWLAEKTKWRESVSAIIVIVGTVLILAVLFWLLGGQIQEQLSILSERLPEAIHKTEERISGNEWGEKLIQFTRQETEKLDTKKILDTALGFFKSTFGILGNIYIILYLGIFFTATPYLYKRGVISLIPTKGKEKANEVMNRLGFTLRSWFAGRIITMFAVFLLVTGGMLLIGVPVPLALGFIAGLLNFIPNFGPLIALFPALLIGGANGNNLFVLIGIYIGAQAIEGNLITPLVQKRLINIPPALIIIGQVILGLFGGVLGLALATPVMAILMVLVNSLYIEPMKRKESMTGNK